MCYSYSTLSSCHNTLLSRLMKPCYLVWKNPLSGGKEVTLLTADFMSMLLWLSYAATASQRGLADASLFSCLVNLCLMGEF